MPVGAEWLEKLPLRDPRIDENRYQVRPPPPSQRRPIGCPPAHPTPTSPQCAVPTVEESRAQDPAVDGSQLMWSPDYEPSKYSKKAPPPGLPGVCGPPLEPPPPKRGRGRFSYQPPCAAAGLPPI